MPTNNTYTPEIVNLTGGLDFVTPKPSVAPGALVDCFNYEVADALGYKRVDGIERFDGRPSISNCYATYYAGAFDSAPAVGEILYVTGDSTQEAFAVVTSVDIDTNVFFYVFNMEKFLYMVISGSTISDTAGNVYSDSSTVFAWRRSGNTTIEQAITAMNSAYSDDAEPMVTSIATQEQGDTNNYSSAIGLQLWNDQLYAVVNFDSVILTTVTEEIFPGDILDISGTSQNILVRDVQIVSGAYSTADAVLKVSFSYLDVGDYNIASKRTTFAPAATVDIVRGSTTVTGVGVVGTTATILSTRMAGLFRSWGIETLPDGSLYTDQGWQEIDLGYLMSYNALSQNSGIEFTRAGRNAQPTASSITSLVAGQSALAGTPTPSAGGPVGGGGGDNFWHQGSSDVTTLLGTVDAHTLGIFMPQPQAPHSGTTNTIAISGWDFSSLPADALISGLSVTVVASHANFTSNVKVQVSPSSDFISGAVPKSTRKVSLVQTSATFPTTIGSQSVTVTSVANFVVGDVIYINDGTGIAHGIKGTITAINSGTSTLTFDVTEITFGVSGNTQPSTSTVRTANILGGQADLWGTQNITVQALQDSSFALQVAGIGGDNAHGAALGIDEMSVTVYYQETSSVYYFWNGTDDVTGVVTTYTIESGDFATDTATGTLQVANVAAYSTAARQNIQDGDQIRTAPAGAGVCYGTVSGAAVYAGLPSRSQLKANDSSYEFIVANFYGNNQWDAIYGVSGAGRAFTYDGFYFRYIFTGLNDTLDLPRHVAFHNFHLCLQYSTGAVLASVTGAPESFDGTLGAAEFDTGDRGTGMLRMNGTTLGIFCKNSIQALNGTDTTNFSLSILNPYEGAIEYTIADCGKPVYCSYKGISTFDQTAAYGSFLGNRLSANITPWLLPRLTKQPVPLDTSLFGTGNAQPAAQDILFALPVRNKNQYRVYFKDGFCLTLTFQGANAEPTFTLQQIAFTKDELSFVMIPFAHSSAVDSKGRDRNHVSFYNPIVLSNNNEAEYKYVYELDKGWGFGSYPIQAYFTTAHNFYNNPLQLSNPRKIRLHGQTHGASTITAAISSNYGVEDFQYGSGFTPISGPPDIPTGRSNAEPQDISLPRAGFANSPTTLSFDFQPATNICNMAKVGRSFSIQFVTDPTTVEPPHAAQALMMQINDTKGDV